MTTSRSVVTKRLIEQKSFGNVGKHHCIYEWEDALAKTLGVPLYHHSQGKGIQVKAFEASPHSWSIILFNTPSKRFIMSDMRKGFIPIILDSHIEQVPVTADITKKLPFFWVTNQEFYKSLQNYGVNTVHFIPLSLPDKYYQPEAEYKKTIDVAQLGRRNPLLHEFMLEYCKKHPTVEYVYGAGAYSHRGHYSTTRGKLGDILITRKQYMDFLKSVKISLYSTPESDGSNKFGGADFVTPDIYEFAVSYNYLVGIYPDIDEVKTVGLDQICHRIKTFAEFEKGMDYYLNQGDSFILRDKYNNFCEHNLSSKRMGAVKDVLTAHGYL